MEATQITQEPASTKKEKQTMTKKVIVMAGGNKTVGDTLGRSAAVVSLWISRGEIPVKHVIAVSRLTNYKFTPHEIRPDIYPYPNDGLPPHLHTAQLIQRGIPVPISVS